MSTENALILLGVVVVVLFLLQLGTGTKQQRDGYLNPGSLIVWAAAFIVSLVLIAAMWVVFWNSGLMS